MLKQRGSYVAAHDFAAGEDWLQVHGLPEGPRLDVVRFQGQADVLVRGAELSGVHGDAGEPTRAAAPGAFYPLRMSKGRRRSLRTTQAHSPRHNKGRLKTTARPFPAPSSVQSRARIAPATTSPM